MHAIVDSRKLDLCEKLMESEWVLEWKHKAILSDAKMQRGERLRDIEEES